MAFQRLSYPHPQSDSDFESWCVVVFRPLLRCESLRKYGRRGQRQDGIDLSGNDVDGRRVAVQCKLTKKPKPDLEQLDSDINSARRLSPPLSAFIIATTAPRDTDVHNWVLERDSSHASKGLFRIHIYFWEDIEDLISDDPDIRIKLFPNTSAALGPPLTVPKASASVSPEVPSEIENTIIDRQISKIMQRAINGSRSSAINQLLAIKDTQWHLLSDRLRYRVAANLGMLMATRASLGEAAKYFRLAHKHYPDSDRSKALLAAAHSYLGQDKQAYRIALPLCKGVAAPDSIACSILIRSAPANFTTRALRRLMPKRTLRQPDVLVSLFNRAWGERAYLSGISIARKMVRIRPKDPSGHVYLGSAYLQYVLKRMRDGHALKPHNQEIRLLNNAQAALDNAEHLWGMRDRDEFFASLLQHRAMVRRLLGSPEGSLADLLRALSHAPADDSVCLALAYEYDERGDRTSSINVMRRFLEANDAMSVRFHLACHLIDGSATESVREAMQHLRRLMSSMHIRSVDEQRRFEVNYLYRISALRLVELGESFVPSDPVGGAGFSSNYAVLLDALASRLNGSKGEATSSLKTAVQLFELKPKAYEPWIQLAEQLVAMQMHSAALKIYRARADLTRYTIHTPAIIDAARQAGEHEFLVHLLRELRENEQSTISLLRQEADLLMGRGDFSGTVKTLHAARRTDPHNPEWAYYLLEMAYDHNRPDWAQIDRPDVPDATLVGSQLGSTVVRVLAYEGHLREAVQYSYRLYRRYPRDARVAMTLVTLGLLGPATIFDTTQTVTPGTAFRYAVDATGEEHWVVIEDDSVPPPQAESNEVGVDDQLAKAVLGLKAGDSFDLARTFTSVRCTIVAVIDKVFFRARTVADQWSQRFPEVPFVQSFEGPKGAIANPGEVATPASVSDILGSELADALAKRQHQMHDLVGLYQSGIISISVLAHRSRRPMSDVISEIVERRVGIYCAVPGKAGPLHRIGTSELPLIIDNAALASAVLLRIRADSLLNLMKVCVVESLSFGCELAARGLHFWVRTETETDPPRDPADAERRWLRQLRPTIEFIGGGALWQLPEPARSKLRSLFAASTADAIASSATTKGCIWTDDPCVASIAIELGASASVSTPELAVELFERGGLAKAELQAMMCRIADMRYHGWLRSVRTFQSLMKVDEGELGGAPPAHLAFLPMHAPVATIGRLVLEICATLYRTNPSRPRARQVCRWLAKTVASYEECDAICEWIKANCRGAFGVDVMAEAEVRGWFGSGRRVRTT